MNTRRTLLRSLAGSFAAVTLLATSTFASISNEELAALLAKAEGGSGIAQYNLGLIYANQQEPVANIVEAYVWINLAADNGATGKALVLVSSQMTPEQIRQVEDIVNEQINNDLKVSYAEYPTKIAREEKGALGAFGDRYGDTVKVYKMIADGEDKPFSFEICGGPHVDHTSQLAEGNKRFKVTKEESSSAGIRRIKAVLA